MQIMTTPGASPSHWSTPRRHLKRGLGALLFAALVAGTGMPPAAASTSRGGIASVICRPAAYSIALAPGAATRYTVRGTLCTPGVAYGRTVQLLLGGILYTRAYWDWPVKPRTYSWVRAMNAAGYAMLNIDRIGGGASDHPPAAQVTIDANAYVAHQLVRDLRQGPAAFARVMLVGHSLGSLISIVEAGRYRDVDGVILTGFMHAPGPGTAAFSQSGLLPAQTNPALRSLPSGYLRERPGTRVTYFYDPANADPAVIAYDDASVAPIGTATIGELGQFARVLTSPAYSWAIVAPVLVLTGRQDALFGAAAAGKEPSFYRTGLPLKVDVLPDTGHALNLHRSAPRAFALARAWADRHVGA